MKNQNSTQKPFIITIASTKGGSAKSTNAANIGAFCADHGLKTLLIDTDTQPTLSSYYQLDYQAPGGTYEFLQFRDVDPEHIISRTTIPNLDLIQSNDPSNKISPMLRDSPDGALRFSLLLKKIVGYDVIIVDTRGTPCPSDVDLRWARKKKPLNLTSPKSVRHAAKWEACKAIRRLLPTVTTNKLAVW